MLCFNYCGKSSKPMAIFKHKNRNQQTRKSNLIILQEIRIKTAISKKEIKYLYLFPLFGILV